MKILETQKFFNALFLPFFDYQSGYLEIRTIKNSKAEQHFAKSITEAIELTPTLTGDIYFGVAPRSKQSGKKESIEFITSLWTDVDYGKIGHKKYCFFKTQSEAITFIKSYKLPPSIIVDSGYGLHCYWLLTGLFPVDNFENIENILKLLVTDLHGDNGTHNIDRILRIPSTTNCKVLHDHKEVKIIYFDDSLRYKISDFQKNLKINKELSIQDNINLNTLNLSNETRQLIEKGKKPQDSFESRSEADFKVIINLLKSGATDNEIYKIFTHYPIGEKYRLQGNPYLKHSLQKAKDSLLKDFIKSKESASNIEFIDGGSINSVKIADLILGQNKIIFSAENFYQYSEGVYTKTHEEQIHQLTLEILKTKTSQRKSHEIIHFLKIKSFIVPNILNCSPYLNLKNGLFNLDNFALTEHNQDNYSTIQLNIEFNKHTHCPLWEQTINEIFEQNIEKIQALQEFMGLCLTKETKYEKALFLIGDGANGKSVILYILGLILGKDNYSAISLEKFNDSHYLANLFGKLANISTETNVKSEVYDSMFKAVISGDEIQADHKFKQPFKFNPFSKLVFSLNNMPRVDDKTPAFFRRLLILRFNREFPECEQNKNLKYELETELNGIFNWCLLGLNRLRKRNYFEVDKSIREELIDYQKENNNVLLFVDEACRLGKGLTSKKGDLHQTYQNWCKDNCFRPLSKIKFGKQLIKHFSIGEDKDAQSHYWVGIKSSYFFKKNQ